MTDNLLPDSDVIWKPIIGFENYECTIDGQVRNIKRGTILALSERNRNKFYTLSGRKVSRTRCVQLAFPETIHKANCLTCGVSFDRGFGANYNYCSMECAPQCKADYAKARKEKYKKRHGIEKKPREAMTSKCNNCHIIFKGNRKFCGVPCKNDYRKKQRDLGLDDKGKARKRARKYGVLYEPVKPIDVFNKTKGRCHICKRKLKWEDRGKNLDRSPEIDHLWPMSKGGHHLFENLAISCRVCNANKSDNTFI